jgi:hypothetical protein
MVHLIVYSCASAFSAENPPPAPSREGMEESQRVFFRSEDAKEPTTAFSRAWRRTSPPRRDGRKPQGVFQIRRCKGPTTALSEAWRRTSPPGRGQGVGSCVQTYRQNVCDFSNRTFLLLFRQVKMNKAISALHSSSKPNLCFYPGY